MHVHDFQARRNYAEYISRALATEGGHLAIGHGGATLYFGLGWLSGCSPDEIKVEAVAAGLPVIDSRELAFETAWSLAVRGPMVAVGQSPDDPPWHALSHVPLAVVAAAYRDAGAEVLNIDLPASGAGAGE